MGNQQQTLYTLINQINQMQTINNDDKKNSSDGFQDIKSTDSNARVPPSVAAASATHAPATPRLKMLQRRLAAVETRRKSPRKSRRLQRRLAAVVARRPEAVAVVTRRRLKSRSLR